MHRSGRSRSGWIGQNVVGVALDSLGAAVLERAPLQYYLQTTGVLAGEYIGIRMGELFAQR